MPALPQISETEFEVVKLVWRYAPINTNEITERLIRTTSWGAKTAQTPIKRLVSKGALTYEKQSHVFVYTPLVKEDEYLNQENHSLLKRHYDGNLTAMVSSFLEHDTFSGDGTAALRSLLLQGTGEEG